MTIQKHLRLDKDVVCLVDDWRRKQTPIPTFNEAANMILRSLTVETVITKYEPSISYDGKPYTYKIYAYPPAIKEEAEKK